MRMHSSYWTLEKEHILKPKPHEYNETAFINSQALTFCTFSQHEAVPEGGVQVSSRRWVCAKCWPHFVKKKLKK